MAGFVSLGPALHTPPPPHQSAWLPAEKGTRASKMHLKKMHAAFI